MKFIIEHMEDEVSNWCYWEYENISKVVGKKNLIITNSGSKKLEKLGLVKKKSVVDLNLKRACLLDPAAKETLKPSDAKKFDYLVFGGILGDFPRKGRTKILAEKLDAPKRNLGMKQMSTDNAVLAAKLIVDGTSFDKIKFLDKLEIPIDVGESVELPYRYVLLKGRPFIHKKIIQYLMKHPL